MSDSDNTDKQQQENTTTNITKVRRLVTPPCSIRISGRLREYVGCCLKRTKPLSRGNLMFTKDDYDDEDNYALILDVPTYSMRNILPIMYADRYSQRYGISGDSGVLEFHHSVDDGNWVPVPCDKFGSALWKHKGRYDPNSASIKKEKLKARVGMLNRSSVVRERRMRQQS